MPFGRTMAEVEFAEAEGQLALPRIKHWVAQHDGNPDFSPETIDAMVDILSGTENQDRSGRFGASSRGTCLRKQLFTYLGLPGLMSYNSESGMIFLDGHFRHLRWQMVGLEAGAFTHIEVPVARKKWRVKISLDACNHTEGWMFELKGTQWFSDAIPEKHELQMTTCLVVTGYEACSYVQDAKAINQAREWVFKPSASMVVRVTDELDLLNHYVDTETLPPVLKGCSGARKSREFKDCPFRKTCPMQDCGSWPGNGWDYPLKPGED